MDFPILFFSIAWEKKKPKTNAQTIRGYFVHLNYHCSGKIKIKVHWSRARINVNSKQIEKNKQSTFGIHLKCIYYNFVEIMLMRREEKKIPDSVLEQIFTTKETPKQNIRIEFSLIREISQSIHCANKKKRWETLAS